MRRHKQHGFTIVELLVVIVVIGILVSVSVIGYGAWRTSTLETQVKSDLSGAAAAMEDARTFDGSYPTTLPASFSGSDGVTLTGGGSVDGKSFCIDAVSDDDAGIVFYIDDLTKDAGAQEGTCAARSITAPPLAPAGLAVGTVTTTTIALSWSAAASATSYRAQCATDGAFTTGVVTSTGATTSRTLTGLASGTLYFCRVQATNGGGASSWSASVTTSTTGTAISVPAGFSITGTGDRSVTLGWSAVSGATGYIARCASNSGYTAGLLQTGTITGTSTSFTNMTIGNVFCSVRAVTAAGQSAWTADAQSRVTILNGLLGWWRFNGNTTDQIAAYSPTVVNMALATGQNGVANNAYNFTNGYMTMGERYNSQAVPVTISAWVFRNSATTNFIFQTDAHATQYYGAALLIGATNTIEVRLGSGGGAGPGQRRSLDVAAGPISSGNWYHIVATIRGITDMTVYVDGVNVGGTYSGTGTGYVPLATVSPAGIGRNSIGAAGASDRMDDIRFYNRSLSADEVADLYAAGAD